MGCTSKQENLTEKEVIFGNILVFFRAVRTTRQNPPDDCKPTSGIWETSRLLRVTRQDLEHWQDTDFWLFVAGQAAAILWLLWL